VALLVGDFDVTLADNPFESRLDRNYGLMVDECREQVGGARPEIEFWGLIWVEVRLGVRGRVHVPRAGVSCMQHLVGMALEGSWVGQGGWVRIH